MNDVVRVLEDATAEKNVVITRDTDSNPQYAYVANYLWFFFVEDKKFHIMGCFKDPPRIEYHSSVKIWFKDEHFCHYERTEPFPFDDKKGDEYDIVDDDWIFIEVIFRVTKIDSEDYLGLSESDTEDQNGMIVVVGNQKVFLNMDTIVLQSVILSDALNNSEDVTLKLSDVNPDVFFEMLRVLNPPFKRISRYYFTDLLLLACRFRMQGLLARLEEFSKTPEYDEEWINKVAWKKIQRILREDPSFTVQVLENFRLKRREEKPVRKVRISDPEVSSVHEPTASAETSCVGALCNYFSNHKTRIIFLILSLFLVENMFLLIWFLCIYNNGNQKNRHF